MTKILIKQSIAGAFFSYRPGDIVDLETPLANAWVAGGIAEYAPKDKPKAETAVAKAPETPEVPKIVVPVAPKIESKEPTKKEG